MNLALSGAHLYHKLYNKYINITWCQKWDPFSIHTTLERKWQWAAPKQLSFDSNISENFRKFVEHWLLFEKTELKERTQDEKCSYFLLLIGEKGREVHKTLTFTTPEYETDEETRTWKHTTAELTTAFKEYCSPKKKITYERHKFNTRNQGGNESSDQYVTELRILASTCKFETLKDGLIHDRIICGIQNQTIKERLLREADLTLKKAIDICRAAEVSREQVKSLTDRNSADIDALHKTKQDSRRSNLREDFRDQQNREYNHTRKNNCNNCGQQHAAKSCPAYGKSCNNCHKLGHFAKLCRSTNRQRQREPIRDLECEENQYEHEDGIDTIETTSTSIEKKSITSANTNVHEMTKNEHASITFNNNKTLSFKLDTGAETNILTKADFCKIIPKRQRTSKLRPSTAKLTAYGGHAIPILGKCYLQCQYKSSKQVIEFHVVEHGKSLLGCTSCKSLKLVTFHNVDQLHSAATNDTERRPDCSLSKLDSQKIFSKYSQCFEGIGCISKPYHIKLKPDANPGCPPTAKVSRSASRQSFC